MLTNMQNGERLMKYGKMFLKGFTLIELLIVVAIIAILAAIAVLNFLEAQTRAKVTRVVSDFRTEGIAIESYRTDYNKLPQVMDIAGDYLMAHEWPNPVGGLDHPGRLLTTPISYLTSIPWDAFNMMLNEKTSPEWDAKNHPVSSLYNCYIEPISESSGYSDWQEWMRATMFPAAMVPGIISFNLMDCGPDLTWWNMEPGEVFYDPTNGTTSPGDIWYFDGGRIFPKR